MWKVTCLTAHGGTVWIYKGLYRKNGFEVMGRYFDIWTINQPTPLPCCNVSHLFVSQTVFQQFCHVMGGNLKCHNSTKQLQNGLRHKKGGHKKQQGNAVGRFIAKLSRYLSAFLFFFSCKPFATICCKGRVMFCTFSKGLLCNTIHLLAIPVTFGWKKKQGQNQKQNKMKTRNRN